MKFCLFCAVDGVHTEKIMRFYVKNLCTWHLAWTCPASLCACYASADWL